MKIRSRDEHLFDGGPKRILALDGGGIRGMLTLQILKRIESMVQQRAGGDTSVRLCDYFDLIGGTSTGAIIAAGLAMGRSVDELTRLYRQLGNSIFERKFLRLGLLRSKFPAKALRVALEKEFGGVQLGDEEIRTGLAVIAKRLDTGSPWVLHNNPRGKYHEARPGSTAVPNRDYSVQNIVRASTAAPHFFEPEKIAVARDVEGAFVDGGVSPHNNPALQLLLLATLEGHGLKWPLGADQIFIVSLGTGSKEPSLDADEVMGMPAALLAMRSLASLMDDACTLNEVILQWMSDSPTARVIDREVGDLRNDQLGASAPLISYIRYDVKFEGAWLKENLGLELSDDELQCIHEMDKPENLDCLMRVGQAAAGKLFSEDHFPQRFDVT